MTSLPFIDVVGYWLGIFLTFCVRSFLYKDNPFYKFAEHLFVGVSIGYLVIEQYYNVVRPKVVLELSAGHLLALVPAILFGMLIVKAMSRRFSWVGRYPLAFVVALFAGLQINAVAQAELGAQIARAAHNVYTERVDVNRAPVDQLASLPGITPGIAEKIAAYREQDPIDSVDEMEHIPALTDTERGLIEDNRGSVKGLDAQIGGGPYWFGIVSNLLLLAGTLASLLYFYFSLAHKGVVGKVSRFGVWVLMIGFGASFGYTVQGRIALAIGRAQDVMGTKMDAHEAAQIHGPWVALISVAIIVTGIALWEIRGKRKQA